jgi:asparagine synthase (glutamine-hydrolysing)
MCGIAGIVNKNATLSPERLLTCATAMASLMQHRGPDDSGVWVDPDGRAALSHRRLSIIDTSSAGHQPMLSADGHQVLTYNGELYNFRELRAELESGGEHFIGRSDTEVLLRLLTKFGKDALPRLDSMFAFGFYDVRRRELLLARDIFGEKPLYYIDAPGYFAFASELHALTRLPGFDASIDHDAVASYLSLQYLPCPDTIYRSCRKLPPAHWLQLDATGRLTIEPYFAFKAAADQTSARTLDDLADELEDVLARTVKRRLISDVPLGAFLSGGVDSATIAAIAVKKLSADLKTYSVGFEGHAESEHEEARAVAHHLGTDHHEKILTPDALSLGQHIGKVLDEPNGDTSCLPTYLVSEFARESVTVALSGDGGDELFGGYGRYFVTVNESQNRLNGARALRQWRAGDMYLSNRVLTFPDEELLRLFDPLPAHTHRFLQEHRTAITADKRPLINVLREFDAATYLPGAVLAKVDRMSMQHSLEVRAPLLGIEVAKFAMRLAADDCYAHGRGKLVLKRVASRYLPQEWMSRPKRGFGLPMTRWSNEALLPSLRTLLFHEDSALSRWVEPARLRAYVGGLSRDFQPYRAWSLFILEGWLRSHPATAAPRLANSAEQSAAARMQANGRRLRQAAGKIKAAARGAYRAGERALRSRLGSAL